MTEDYFWGLTLDKNKTSDIWDPDFKAGAIDPNGYRGEHTLLLKQATLGAEAKDESHVIEVETAGYKNDVKFPIVVLKPGAVQNATLDLMFPDPPVTFRLIKGSGPVHLLGSHSIGSGDTVVEDEEDDMDDEFDEEDVVDESQEKENDVDRKRKLAMNSHGKKGAKRSKEDEDDD